MSRNRKPTEEVAVEEVAVEEVAVEEVAVEEVAIEEVEAPLPEGYAPESITDAIDLAIYLAQSHPLASKITNHLEEAKRFIV